jgi:DNA-3-methyladenine glycosylase II
MTSVQSTNPVFPRAQRHLARRDPVLRRLIGLIGPCTLRHNPDRFEVLVRSIISQQISARAAVAIGNRLLAGLGKKAFRPASLLAASEETLQAAGLSTAKRLSLRDLAEKVVRRQVPLSRLHELSDEEVIEKLVPVRGIGRWTAEMFLIFALGRLDVLPLADHGLRAGIKRHYGLEELPANEHLIELAEPWRPYRTVATWFMWRSFGFVPQSEADAGG